MRNIQVPFVCLMLALLCACNGVILNAKYSALLEQTAALSAETAARAQAGQLTQAQETQSLVGQARVWAQFRAAAKGKVVESPATQP